ncbi:MAG: hypothetical protein L6Q78_16270, partial [Bacteroidia bacterium]|nr:hypothetical protein [Bacteroidia bacterium]
MKKFLHILFFQVLLLLGKSGSASHLIGSEIRVNMTSATSGTITFIQYRDCSGITWCGCPPGPINSNCTYGLNLIGAISTCNNTSFGTIQLPINVAAGVKDVFTYCSPAYKSYCTLCGTRTAGSFFPGAEVFTFSGPISLSNVPPGCSKVRITFQDCCRNSSITSLTNPASLGFSGFIEFTPGLINSSPVFNSPPLFLVSPGIEVNYNLGATDADGDSLSYRFGPAYTANGVVAPYNSPYSATVPFPYLGAPAQSPPAIPPLGISIDASNGDIRFTPVGNFKAPLIIEVLEWRKINGVMTNIGITRREIDMISNTNNGTYPNPSINTYDLNIQSFATQPFQSYQVREGQQLCFVSVAGTTVAVDTTTFTAQIPSIMSASGATVTPLYDTATRKINGPRMDSVRFCWTPPVGFRRSYPYVFHLTATNS